MNKNKMAFAEPSAFLRAQHAKIETKKLSQIKMHK